jgi:hypothetical protein
LHLGDVVLVREINDMKKLILILVLGFALAACAGETSVVVVTATPVPPTATSIRDRGVEYPSASSITTERPATRTPKPKESQTGSRITLGNPTTSTPKPTEVPLGEQPTRTPGPTSVPLNERFIDHFVEQGFENLNNPTEYIKRAGRGFLYIAIQHDEDGSNPRFGFISRINATPEERELTLAHLDEAASFIDPVDGLDIAYSGMTEIKTNKLTVVNGEWRHWWAEGESWTQFIHTSTGQEVFIEYLYEEENLIKVFFTYLPVGWQHPTE